MLPYINIKRCSDESERPHGIESSVVGVSSSWVTTSLRGGSDFSVGFIVTILLNADALSASQSSALQGKSQFISNIDSDGWLLKQTVRKPSARKTQHAIL